MSKLNATDLDPLTSSQAPSATVILLKSRDAFTLVEVLVAASIMLIGILLNFRQIEFVQSNSARSIARVEFSLLQSQLVQSFNSTTCKGAFFGVADSSISALSTAADLTNNTAISATETTWKNSRKSSQVPTVSEIAFEGATLASLNAHTGRLAVLERIVSRGVTVAHLNQKLSGQDTITGIYLERQQAADGSLVPAVTRNQYISLPLSVTLTSGVARRNIALVADIEASSGYVKSCMLSVMGVNPREVQCNEMRGEWIPHPTITGEMMCSNYYKQEARFLLSSTYGTAVAIPPALPSSTGWQHVNSPKRGFQSASITVQGEMTDWYLNIFREADAPAGVLIYDKPSETVVCNTAMGWNGKSLIANYTNGTNTSTVGAASGSGSSLAVTPFAYGQRIQLTTQTQSRNYCPEWDWAVPTTGTNPPYRTCACATPSLNPDGTPQLSPWDGVRLCEAAMSAVQQFPQYLAPGNAGFSHWIPYLGFGSAQSGSHPADPPLGGAPPVPVYTLVTCEKAF